jgi:hypothetical protein
MKNIVIAFLVLVTTSSFAQNSIKLQVAYIPDHQYSLETKSVSAMVMDAQVDEATKEQLKSSGMAFPIKMDMNQDMLVLMKTGQLNDQKEVPITLEYTKYDMKQMMGDKEMPSTGNVLAGMKASGWGDNTGKLRLENVEGAGVTPELKKLMISMTDQMGLQIVFPSKALKVGDEFTQEVPFNMPLQAGAELKMVVKTVYKLHSFTKENAFFDTTVTMTMDMTVEKGSIAAEGSGKGKMIFDIQKNFMSSYNSNLDLTMKMKMGQMDMDIKSTTESEMTVTHL